MSTQIVSSNSATASAGAPFFFRLLGKSGTSPYRWGVGSITGANAYYVAANGWLYGCPTQAETDTVQVLCYDISGEPVSQTVTIVVGTALTLGSLDPVFNAVRIPDAYVGAAYSGQLNAYAGSGSGYSFTTASGSPPPGLSLASSGAITGTPTKIGNVTWSVKVTDSSSNTFTSQVMFNVRPSQSVSRPAYNSSPGNGFFVLGQKLYDPNGALFPLFGYNRCHYDSDAWTPGVNAMLARPNTVRVFQFWGQTAAYAAAQLNPASGNQYQNMLAILCMNTFPDGSGTTGTSSTTELAAGLSSWYAAYSTLSPYMGRIALNVANEWGAGGSQSWQYAHAYCSGAISAISGSTITVNTVSGSNPFANCPFAVVQGAGGVTNQVVNITGTGGSSGAWTVSLSTSLSGYTSGGHLYGGTVGILRAAGYTCPILIDTGGAGQDFGDITTYSGAIQTSDPLQNCCFAYHAYGSVDATAIGISGISQASTAQVTLAYPFASPNIHPWSLNVDGGAQQFDITNPGQVPGYTGISPNNNSYGPGGTNAWSIRGVQGMTQINGQISTSGTNPLGGVQGSSSWVLNLQGVNSSGYGAYTGGGVMSDENYFQTVMAIFASAAVAQGVCVILGEFGPGRNVNGGSPTAVSIGDLVTSAMSMGLGGVLYWAWDDHDNSDGSSSNYFFGCTNNTTQGAGYWNGVPSGLTEQGLDITQNPRYGMMALSLQAQIAAVSGFYADPYSAYSSFIADTTFVGTNGSSTTVSWNGESLIAPTYQTIQAALTAAAAHGGGSRVCLLSNQSWPVATTINYPSVSGTSSSAWIVIQGDPAATPATMPTIALGPSACIYPNGGEIAVNYTAFRKINITSSSSSGSPATNSGLLQWNPDNACTGILVQYCYLHDMYGSDLTASIFIEGAHQNVEFSYNNIYNFTGSDHSHNNCGIMTYTTPSVYVHHNQIWGSSITGGMYTGIFCKRCPYDGTTNANGWIIEKNIFFNLEEEAVLLSQQGAADTGGFYFTQMLYNLIYNCGQAVSQNNAQNLAQSNGFVFAWNTVAQDVPTGLSFEAMTGIQIHSNVMMPSTEQFELDDASSGGRGWVNQINTSSYSSGPACNNNSYLTIQGQQWWLGRYGSSPVEYTSLAVWQAASGRSELPSYPDINSQVFTSIATNFPNYTSRDYTLASGSALKGTGYSGTDPGYISTDCGPGWTAP